MSFLTGESAPSSDQGEHGPLSGILVADFSRVLAGPYATMLLGDMGATVIKVESPEGDDTRTWSPPAFDGEATYYLSINRNKQSVVLNLKDPADLRLAHELASRADVVIQNMKPGGMDAYGLDHDSVRAANPDVIYAAITGFGTTGGRDLPGYDLLVQAISGLMDVTGDVDTPPYRTGVAVFDVITGLHTAIAISSALFHRQRTGEGQLLELDLLSCALSGLVNATGGTALTGSSPRRMGNEHASIYPYAPFQTADGELIVAVGNNRQFTALCETAGIPEVAADPRFANNTLRSANRRELRDLLTAAFGTRPAEEWFPLLRARSIPCAPILDVAGGIAFAEKLGLEPVVEVGEGDRVLRGIRNPVRFSRTPVTYRHAPPRLDHDGEHIRRWLSKDNNPASSPDPASAQKGA